jgi:acetyltransferase
MLTTRHALAPLIEPREVLLVSDGSLKLGQLGSQTPVHQVAWPGDSADWPCGVDLVAIAVSRYSVTPVLNALESHQPGAVMVLSQDPAPELTQACQTWAQRTGIPLLGPHCFGLQRPHRGLNLSAHPTLARPGTIALVCQSRALTGALLDWADDNQTAFSTVISLGTEADVGLPQVLDFLASDPRTDSIALYLEDVQQSRRFMSALRAAASVKPVVVLKAGHRDEARSSVRPLGDGARPERSASGLSHDQVFDSAIRRAGAVRVRFFVQLFSALKVLAFPQRPSGQRLAILSNGGGPAQLALDWAPGAGLTLACLSPETLTRLAGQLSDSSWQDNPVVEFLPLSASRAGECLQALLCDSGVDGVLVVLAPDAHADLPAITHTIANVGKQSRKPVLACLLGDATMRPLRRDLEAGGIPAFRTPETAVDAFGTLASYYYNQQLLLQIPRRHGSAHQPDLEAARLLIEDALARDRLSLGEPEAKSLVAAFGIPVVPTLRVQSLPDAVIAAQNLGFPIALKVSSPDIARKSLVGGVLLDIRNTAELTAAWARLQANLSHHAPDARIDGMTVQGMAGPAGSIELAIGLYTDPGFGPVITFGIGGARVELIQDRALELVPLNGFLARRLMERTRVWSRSLKSQASEAVMQQLEDILIAVSDLACDFPQLASLELNPLILNGERVLAADARVTLRSQANRDEPAIADPEDAYGHMAIHPYPAELEQHRVFPDGTPWCIRPVRPEDAQALQDFTRSLSEHTRYMRFISTMRELSPRLLARYTNIDYHRELALLATVTEADPQEPGQLRDVLIGVARYLRNPDGQSAEYALVIGDAWQGRGLGRELMSALIDAARAKGLKRLEGFVLANNGPMLKLMTRLGMKNDPDPDDPSMRRVWMDL